MKVDAIAARARRARERRGFPWSAPAWPGAVQPPAPNSQVGVDYPTGWARRYPIRLARAMVLDNVARPVIHVLAAPAVHGEDVLELVEPPVIFVANHASHVDTPLLLSVLPPRIRHRTVVAAAADHFFDRRWKAHLWSAALAAIPIERQRVNRRSAEVAAALVEDGWNLVIFPEGGRSPDGWFQPFKGGAAYLAARTARPVVPVHLRGTWRILPKDGARPRRGHTSVVFGSPLRVAPDEDARHLGVRIEQALATLADEGATDWWQARRRAAAGTTPSPHGPQIAAWRRTWARTEASEPLHEAGKWAMRSE